MDPDRQQEEVLFHPETPWYQLPFFRRLLGLVFPPAGLWLTWHNPNLRPWARGLELGFFALYSGPYVVAAVWVLTQLGWIDVEWKGGFGPSLVRHRTAPDYRALERHRNEQTVPATMSNVVARPVAPYWTDMRGPRRDGRYEERPIRTDWKPDGPRLQWKQPIGGGYASFVVADGRAFTIEQRREDEAVTAYDLETGRELWAHTYAAHFEEWMGGDGPRATPTYHDALVYSLGATGEFCCLGAATGRALWQKNILTENGATNLHYGMAASPLIVDDKVVVLTGSGSQGRAVVAYHRVSGDPVWSALDDKPAYASPMLASLAGQRQVLVVMARRVVGLAPDDGRRLWDFAWQVAYDNSIALPVLVSSNRFLISSGYGAGCAVVELVQTNGAFAAREVWRNRAMKNKFNPSVFWDGFIYGLDEGVLACVDAATGVRRWREGSYGYGQLLLASGHLIVLGGDGQLGLVRADPSQWVEVARVPALTGKTWNLPALADGRLLVRNNAEMACYDLRVSAAAEAGR